MTIISTANATDNSSALVTEFAGGAASEITMMIGVGSVKDSDAVFFEYIGDKQHRALRLQSDKPLTSLKNVTCVGLTVADNIGEFDATKLNVILQSSGGTQVMVTSGLTTFWSMAVVGGLMALFNGGDVKCPFNLDTWRGTAKMKPCFAAIKVDSVSMKDAHLFEQLTEARTDGNKKRVETIMRDAVQIINHAITGGPIEEAAVVVSDAPVDEALADF
jgi:hypothetical protein